MSIFLAVPSRGSLVTGTAMALLQTGRTPIYCVRSYVTSLLTKSFNQLWCDALNERKHGITHFVMMHDDVVPLDSGWLDTLMAEYVQCGADILSTIIPIKDEHGLTSTAFYHPPTNKMRRLTMTEAYQIPVTFDAALAGYPDCKILPNTGLWVCDFTKPWVEKICFTIRDKNFQLPSGQWVTMCWGEDWDFGVQAHRLGLDVWTTRAVNLTHRGTFDYPSVTPWGAWKEDPATGIYDPEESPDRTPELIYE